MQRYFFHVHNGHYMRDTSGVELANRAMAQSEAAKLVGALWFDSLSKGPDHEIVAVEVTNVAGLVLFTMTLRLKRAPLSKVEEESKVSD